MSLIAGQLEDAAAAVVAVAAAGKIDPLSMTAGKEGQEWKGPWHIASWLMCLSAALSLGRVKNS